MSRPMGEIRADLAKRAALALPWMNYSPELDDVDDRLALDVEPLLAERDALSAVIDNVRALCVELTTELPLRILNGDAVVRVSDVTRRIYMVLAAGETR